MANAGSRKEVRALEKEAERAETARQEVVKMIMSTGNGREWMHNLLALCGIGRNPHATDQPLQTAYNCGTMQVGLNLWADVMNISPDQYLQMMREANERAAADATRARESAGGPDTGGDTDRPEPEAGGDEGPDIYAEAGGKANGTGEGRRV